MSNSEQKARLDQAALNLIFAQPFFGTLLMHLKRVEITPDHAYARQIHTMAVDGANLYWNPAFVAQLSKAQIMGVLAHEVLHCALRHFLRMESRDPRTWNQATDYAINRDILLGGFSLPDSWQANGKTCKPCVDSKGEFKGLDSEAIYNRLRSAPPPPPPQGGSGKGQGDGSQGAPSPANGQGAASDAQGEDGQGEDANGATGQSSGLGDGIGDGLGDVMPSSGTEAEQADLGAEWQVRITQAAKQADKSKGFVPGMVREAIATLQNPRIDWKEKLRAFVGTAISDDATWSRPQKRLVSRGLWLPSVERDKIHKLAFLVDTSGSMQLAALTAAFSEAESMLAEGGVQCILWANVDTRVASHGELFQGDSFEGFTVSGRGGTDFEKPMEWLAEQAEAEDIAACIFFTDGETYSWGNDPGIPVLWIGAESDKASIEKAPYGETALIKL